MKIEDVVEELRKVTTPLPIDKEWCREAAALIEAEHAELARLRSAIVSPSGPMEAWCLPSFMRAAAAVAAFELRVRIVADLAPEGNAVQREAINGDLSALIEMLCDRHGASKEDRAFLLAVASIRNKLFHLELSKAVARVRPLVPLEQQLRQGGVLMADLDTGKATQVSKLSTANGRILGWMLEAASSGAFEAVVVSVRKAIAVLNAMRDNENAMLAGKG